MINHSRPARVNSSIHEIVEALSRETDITIVVTSHVLSEIERLCDRVVLLDDGGVQVAGDVADLRRATGDTISVVTTVEDDPDRVVAHIEECDGVTAANAIPPQVYVECQRNAVFGVLESLRETADIVNVEVTEPGLDAVFQEVVSASRSVTLSGTRGESQ